jgi:chromosome segregation ATPase
MRFHMLCALFLILAAGTGLAQTVEQKPAEEREIKKKYLYQWTDDRGVVHMTDELGKVPEKYREQAMQLEVPKKEQTDERRMGQQAPAAPSSTNTRQRDDARKAQWQRRMREARQQLADAERRYQELEQQRKEALESAGSPATGRRQGRVEAERIEQEMQRVRQDIEAARTRLEVDLPEEARKAGVPPGWLRE